MSLCLHVDWLSCEALWFVSQESFKSVCSKEVIKCYNPNDAINIPYFCLKMLVLINQNCYKLLLHSWEINNSKHYLL